MKVLFKLIKLSLILDILTIVIFMPVKVELQLLYNMYPNKTIAIVSLLT